MTIEEFGRSVKSKYPQYQGVSDAELGKKVLEKYPQYQRAITTGTTPTLPAATTKPAMPAAKPTLVSGIVGAATNRADKYSALKTQPGNLLEKGMRAVGQGAGLAMDVGFEALKGAGRLTPDVIEEPAKAALKTGITAMLGTKPGQEAVAALEQGMESYQAWKKRNPRLASDLEAVTNIAALLPVGRITKAGAEAASTAVRSTALGAKSLATSTTKKVAQSAAGKVLKEGVETVGEKADDIIKGLKTPAQGVDDLVGAITQPKGGKAIDISSATKALADIDTQGVKTFSELGTRINAKLKEVGTKLDEVLDTKPETIKLPNLATSTQVGEQMIPHNYVDDALKQLDELYTKTNDPVGQAKVAQLIEKANKEGLTIKEVNNLAKEHGIEFGSKAFSKLGEPLTSVNAQAFENTRSGLKETARNLFDDPVYKAADEQMAALIRTRTLVKKMDEAVNTLRQKIQPYTTGQKIGRVLTQAVDLMTGGMFKGAVSAALPRGVGYKVLNALDLEKGLEKNLKLLQELIKADVPESTIMKQLEDFLQSSKSMLPAAQRNINTIPKNTNIPVIPPTLPQSSKKVKGLPRNTK